MNGLEKPFTVKPYAGWFSDIQYNDCLAFIEKYEGELHTVDSSYEESPSYEESLPNFAIVSNIEERTLNSNFNICTEIDCNVEWKSEGQGTYNQSANQIVQFMNACRHIFDYAKTNKPLTFDIIRETHKILMSGSDEQHIGGMTRTGPVSTYTHSFPNCERMEKEVESMCSSFEYEITIQNPLESASKLMHRFVQLHPFWNGNGRMCRILFAYAMMRAGVSHCIPFTSTHTKSRKHYINALRKADRGNYKEMFAIALMSFKSIGK